MHAQDESIRFGPFELKPQSGELRRDGTAIKLPPQPFKVLLLLAENAGQLVTRKELHEKIWGHDTFVDFDKGLNLCIAQIREALGDDAQSRRYIETLPRRGYRFIATVHRGTSRDLSSQIGETTGTEQSVRSAARRFRLRKSPALIFTVIVVLIVSLLTVFYLRSLRPSSKFSAQVAKSMLLVLPFENLTNDPAQDYFSDGLTEEMITRLGSLQPKRLGVIARTTALTYKKSGKDIRQIGRELGVSYVLEGSVRREGGRIRITSQLIQVDDQTHLWAETFDRNETDLLDIQREVATRVASSLSLELLPASYSEVAGKLAKPEAYDAYLKGRYLITKDTLEDLQRSIPYFDSAIAADPNFAPAYAAEVEALVLITDWTGSTAAVSLPKAKAAALKTIELSPSYAEGYAALGAVQFWLEWNWHDAELNFRRAVELNPYNPLTRLNYGRCLLARGHMGAGVNEINEAVKLDPVSLLTTGLAAFAQLHSGRFDEAIALSNRMLELEPKSWAARECLFRAYIGKGNYRDALNTTRERMVQEGAKPEELKVLDKGTPKDVIDAHFRTALGHMNESARKGERVWNMYGAWLCVRLGEKDQAFAWLEKAASERAPFLVYLSIDPMWEPLRSDARFASLARVTG
ncbi:MAG: winged helix-turn-helix domain-containing tetratricopeptide repeat protein [Pyrinomonadaceae bacterium]